MLNMWVFLYFTVFGLATVFFLTDSRLPAKKTILIETAATILLVLLESVLYQNLDQVRFMQSYFFTVHLPCLILSWLLSKKRDTRILFVLFITIMYCSFILQAMSLVYLLTDGSEAAAWCTLVGSTAAIGCFTVFYFRSVFFNIVEDLKNLLGILAVLLAAYFFINGYLVPAQIGDNRLVNIVKMFMTLTAMVVFILTCVMFFVLRKKNEIQRDAELLSTQLGALEIKITAMKEAEEKIRIERHDIRHRLKTIETLLYENKKEDAIQYIANAEHHLDEIGPQRYCANTVLDAVISYYCEQAKKIGIAVDVRLALPNELPVDSAELSMVFANALENAVHAAKQCPPGGGKIWITAVSYPAFMIEIANTFQTKPSLDENGLPIAKQKGHGLGSRSIAAFCKKSGASYQYSVNQKVFKLYLSFS